jgi:hypothetical protein
MATVISDLNPPITLYKQMNIEPQVEEFLTGDANIKPGMPLYRSSATEVLRADRNAASPAMQLLGYAGWKRGHELDDAYASGTTIPVIYHTPGMIIPTWIADPGEDRDAGHMYLLDTNPGQFDETPEDYTSGRGHGYLFEDIADDDRVAWMVCT